MVFILEKVQRKGVSGYKERSTASWQIIVFSVSGILKFILVALRPLHATENCNLIQENRSQEYTKLYAYCGYI